jgi:hypothetical protein
MDFEAVGHADERRAGNGRLVRMLAAGGLTAALAAGLLATGAVSYVATAFGTPPDKGPAGKQYGDTRPGWGCGDRNHVHTGPPGRQYATPPPGCRR